ncbi:MAG: hypothetical protein RSF67_00410 [Clostridia bacterium]
MENNIKNEYQIIGEFLNKTDKLTTECVVSLVYQLQSDPEIDLETACNKALYEWDLTI